MRSATGWCVIGFGCDPAHVDRVRRSPSAGAPAAAASSSFVQSGSSVAPAGAFEDVSGELVPGIARKDWIAIIRPDRVIVADGPAQSANALVGRTLESCAAPKVRAPAPAARARESHSANAHRGQRLVMRNR